MSLITGSLITGRDWNLNLFLRTVVNFRVPGSHSNCSTIRAGGQLRSYTSEKTVVFFSKSHDMPIKAVTNHWTGLDWNL